MSNVATSPVCPLAVNSYGGRTARVSSLSGKLGPPLRMAGTMTAQSGFACKHCRTAITRVSQAGKRMLESRQEQDQRSPTFSRRPDSPEMGRRNALSTGPARRNFGSRQRRHRRKPTRSSSNSSNFSWLKPIGFARTHPSLWPSWSVSMTGRNCSCILRNGTVVSTPARVASWETRSNWIRSGPLSERRWSREEFTSRRCGATSRTGPWPRLLHPSTPTAGGDEPFRRAGPVGKPGPEPSPGPIEMPPCVWSSRHFNAPACGTRRAATSSAA